MASSQASARWWQARCAADRTPARGRAPAGPWRYRRYPGRTRWQYSKAQPEGSVLGRLTDQSPLRRISLASSQSAARRSARGAADRPAPARRRAMPVSQTGEKQGWKKNRSPSSTIRSLNWRSASARSGIVRRRSPERPAPSPSTSWADRSRPGRRSGRSRSIIHAAARCRWRLRRSASEPWRSHHFSKPVERQEHVAPGEAGAHRGGTRG